MESVATRATFLTPGIVRRIDGNALAIWAFAGALVLYLGFDGGGYDPIVSSQSGVIVWWVVLIGAAWGVLPHHRLGRAGWAGLGLLGAFAAWTALATTWSLSTERSLEELSRVACYVGVLVLALGVQRDRERGLRHTTAAVACAIVALAGFAVVSRLIPGAFPAAHVTASFLAGSQRRLSWPLNYWNGLGALAAMGIPLLLSLAGSARSLLARGAAVAGLPLLVLCEYLTFSRGGAIAVAVALVIFLLFAGERLDKLASALVGAAGGAILVLGAHHRQALENGFTGHLAVLQGRSLLVAVVVTCLGAGLAQAGIAFAARHGTSPLQISRRTARIGLAVTLVALVAIGLGVGGASRLQHAWRDFKSTSGTGVTGNFAARYGSLAGNDRYQYWQVAVHQGAGHRLAGTGPGTFQLLWDPHASLYSPVLDAHSLYVQTLAEVGVVGLVLLVAFFLVLLGCAVRATMTRDQAARTRAASALAALVAFLVSAAVEWVWQLPVLPVVFMLLAAAVLAPPRRTASVRRTLAPHPARGEPEHPSRATAALRPALVVLAAACILGIGVPLAATGDVRSSQDAVQTGDLTAAVTDARSAVSVESGAAEPYLQLALVLELQHRLSPAIAAATHSIRNEPLNWASWLVLSRLQAEDGHPTAALTAYRRARALNPRSPLFSPA